MIKKPLIAAALLAGFSAPAIGATVVLGGTAADDKGGTRFGYLATIGAEGSLHRGSTFIIYNFAGYIEGSIFTSGDLAASIERVGALPRTDGLADDPSLVNLIFTYVGSPVRNFGGPFDFGSFGASSRLNHSRSGIAHTDTVKYDPVAGRVMKANWQGALLVPAPIPEPVIWATMLAGFGLAGVAIRRHRLRLAMG